MQPTNYEQLKDMAGILARSGAFGAKTMESAFATMARGMSLGIPPVVAMSEMHLIEGRVELSADLMAGLVLRSGLCEEWTFLVSTHEACTLRTRRKGAAGPVEVCWTMGRADRAGLAKRANFAKFPEAMLRARAISELARMVYPDVVAGIYVRGEIGAERDPEEALPSAASGAAVAGVLPGQLALGLEAPAVLASSAVPATATPNAVPFVPQAVVAMPPSAAMPDAEPSPAPAPAARVVEQPATRTAPSPLAARLASAGNRDLLGLASEVVRDRAAWAPYAEEWTRRAGSFDAATITFLREQLVACLPDEVRAVDAFVALGEALDERLGVLSEQTHEQTEQAA